MYQTMQVYKNKKIFINLTTILLYTENGDATKQLIRNFTSNKL